MSDKEKKKFNDVEPLAREDMYLAMGNPLLAKIKYSFLNLKKKISNRIYHILGQEDKVSYIEGEGETGNGNGTGNGSQNNQSESLCEKVDIDHKGAIEAAAIHNEGHDSINREEK